MSNTSEQVEQDCDAIRSEGATALLLRPKDKDLGGFTVRRALPSQECRQVGPWVFFDHMGPARFGEGPGIDVRPHPHINLATVTYLFTGEMLHRDSLGSEQIIRPGAINLMVAGRGIVHSERERPEARQRARELDGLQLWLALPEADEETAPAFHHYAATDIPEVSVQGVPVRVMMGTAYATSSPVKTYAETLYVEADLQENQKLALPHAAERALYVVQGRVGLGGQEIAEHTMAVLAPDSVNELRALEPSRIALIGGEPVGKRYMFWNFVSSRQERIEQAKADWQAGRFPKVPGDEQEFIPLP